MNEFVYHYTTLSAIPGIIGKKCLCFWATHRAFLNDPQEGIFGRSILKDILPGFSYCDNYETFILSLSANINSIPMWTSYADGGKGVALKLSTKVLLDVRPAINITPCFYGREARLEAQKMVDMTKLGIIDLRQDSNSPDNPINNKSKTEEIRSYTQMRMYINLLNSIKEEYYRYEEEFRIYNGATPDSVKFRERKDVLIPYIEMSFPKQVLSEIIIGPANSKELASSSITQLLKYRDYNNVLVTKSRMQFRG